ncbi:MAG: CRISPR-associated protein Cas5 [Pyrinomonadaceae bacterium]
MSCFWLRIEAPFAAFRAFQAGVYRSSAPVIPPSAAYGLILNLAGIEMRDSENRLTTGIRKGLPKIELATGLLSSPGRATIYQQLHSYPVGNSGKEIASLAKGAKFWITPVRREILTDYVGVIGVRTDDLSLQNKVIAGLRGEIDRKYGLPFAGDNNLLFSKIDVHEERPAGAIWYLRHEKGETNVRGSCRLYVGIDRFDNSKTISDIYVPRDDIQGELPANAWTQTSYD